MTYTCSQPFDHTLGPRNAKIMLVGEAWGEQEERLGRPFIGTSGQELTRMLEEAGLQRNACLLTNVLPIRPAENKLASLCYGSKKEAPPGYALPPISDGKYLRQEFLPELGRLRQEILTCNPNIIIALGNAACWALLQMPKITAIRGAVAGATLCTRPGGGAYKVLPTFHPAYVLRSWQDRVVVIQDFLKASYEAEFPEIRRPERDVLINPTLDEISEWTTRPATMYSVDIETYKGQIEMIGFARSRAESIVIPFIDRTRMVDCLTYKTAFGEWPVQGLSYWGTWEEEVAARLLCDTMLNSPIPKLFQNGLFDMQYLLRDGFKLQNVFHDTMILHHALYPEIRKGLGFLGSVYTNEASWKLMRNEESHKREE